MVLMGGSIMGNPENGYYFEPAYNRLIIPTKVAIVYSTYSTKVLTSGGKNSNTVSSSLGVINNG